jgi:hypothetical protein
MPGPTHAALLLMKFIIAICDRFSPGQYPKLPDFQFSQKHQKYVYIGRELDASEFNEACARVFDPKYRNKEYHFMPAMILEIPEIKKEESGKEESKIPELRFEGRAIFLGETRVAGLFGDDNHLRVVAEFNGMRDQIETFVKSQPTPAP